METIVKKYVAKPRTKKSETELQQIEDSINATIDQINAVENSKDGITFENENHALDIKKKQLRMLQKRKDAIDSQDRIAGKKFRKINLDFLKRSKLQKIEGKVNGNKRKGTIKVPVFSVHRLSTYSKRYTFEASRFDVDIKGGKVTSFDLCGFHYQNPIYQRMASIYKQNMLLINWPRVAVAAISDREFRVRAKDSFSGLIPKEVKEEVIEAKDLFDDLYLIKEANWQVEMIEKDPLIIGLLDGEAYLVSHFDCTPFEHYVKSEF
jgi:hypothetical protein